MASDSWKTAGVGSYVSNRRFKITPMGSRCGIQTHSSKHYHSQPDFVGVDLFSGSNPAIDNLTIEGGGQDVHGISNTWRYGIGLSVGSGSSPILELVASGLITRQSTSGAGLAAYFQICQ